MSTILRASLSLAVIATGGYSYCVYRSLAPTIPFRITTSRNIPQSLVDSTTNKTVVNPNNHLHSDDSRDVRLVLDKSLSDEQILARFVNGFFGGWIFGPERMALQTMRMQLVQVAALGDTPVPERIWSATTTSQDRLAKIGTIYYGAFQVADRFVRDPPTAENYRDNGEGDTTQGNSIDTGRSESYIDFVFGSDEGIMRGVHRFSVLHDVSENDGHTQEVVIRFSQTNCNPRENKPWGPAVVEKFHLVYAMLLFREGLAEVLK